MSAAWIAFARSGSPNTPQLPSWTPYEAQRRATMIFNDACSLVDDPNRQRRLAMQAALKLT
jgi:para-nitrobenzyl esterase